MDELKDLRLTCTDGMVPASSFVIASISNAEIVRASLLLNRETLALPFKTKFVTVAVTATHSGIDFHTDVLDSLTLDDINEVAAVFDFLSAQKVLDQVIDYMFPIFRTADLAQMVAVLDTMFKHSNQEIWESVARSFFAVAPFWSTLQTMILDRMEIDIRITWRIIRALSLYYSPQWLFTTLVRQLPSSIEPESALEILSTNWGEHAHPNEVGEIIDAVLSVTKSGEKNAIITTLANIRDSVSPDLYFALRASHASLYGSVVAYHTTPKITISVEASDVKRGRTRRRVSPGVSIVINTESVTMDVNMRKLDCGTPRYMAARLALVRHGTCAAEEWFYLSDGPNSANQHYVFHSGSGKFLPPSAENDYYGTSIADAMRRYTSFWIRFDAFYAASRFDSIVLRTVSAL